MEISISRDAIQEPVLAVDLDGTLTLSDTLYESILLLLRAKPWVIFITPFWLVAGKAAFKAKIASVVSLDVAELPYHAVFVSWLVDEKRAGRKIVLCTASHITVAAKVSQHFGFFDDVIASTGDYNCAGLAKRAVLDERFGASGYDYAGNSEADLPIWRGARRAILVNAKGALVKKASAVSLISHQFPGPIITSSILISVLRVHQWLKNLLLFVPLLAAHEFSNMEAISILILAFVSFSLCASSVYIVNDLLDLESDRKHPRKRNRPFASAAMPIKWGVIISAIFFAISLHLAFVVGTTFVSLLFFYFIVTLAYSLWMKRFVLLDCLTLAGLYTLRIIAGAMAVAISLSFWLLAFSVFIFLSLAFVKRYAELQAHAQVGNSYAHGRGYRLSDAPLVQTLGVAAGYGAVLLLALYLHGETVSQLYAHPRFLWFAVPLTLFWISWVWIKAHRGEMHDDPIIFAVKDKVSILVATLTAVLFLVASNGVSG